MKLIVCGGRHYGDREGEQETLWRMLDLLVRGGDTIIEGGCDGADTLAWRWWKKSAHAIYLAEYWIDDGYGNRHQMRPPDVRAQYIQCGSWSDGKHVGPYRYKRMIDESGADLVLAAPGDDGTEGTIAYARKRGLTVLRIEP